MFIDSRPRGWRLRPWQISVLVSLGLIALWEALAYAFPTSAAEAGIGSPLIPGWGWIVTHAFPAIANYGGDGMGLTDAEGGAAGNYVGAITAIASHSLVTWTRLLIGLACGGIAGIGFGIAISWSRIARMIFALPAHILKTLPLLAMIPLFQVYEVDQRRPVRDLVRPFQDQAPGAPNGASSRAPTCSSSLSNGR